MSAGIHLELLPAAEVDELRADVLARLGERASATEAALQRAPGGWTMGGRAAEPWPFGDGTALVAGGPAAAVRDRDASAARPLLAADATAFCRLAGALPEVRVVAPPAVQPDAGCGNEGGEAAGSRRARLSGLAAGFAATGKHLLATVADVAEAQAAVDMGAAVMGGGGRLRERPPLSVAVMPSADGAVAACAAAESGVPVLVSGAPAEASRAELVATLAGALPVVVAVQEAAPGSPVGLLLRVPGGGSLDAAALSLTAAAAQVARAFGLPLCAAALATRASEPGWLASAECTAATLTAWLAGVAGLAGAGSLDGGAAVSLVKLALDAETASYVAAGQTGVKVDDETLALDVIEKVGIGGNYLGEKHTRRHMPDVWRPRFFDRTPYEQWLREDRRESVDLAAAFVDRVLAQQSGGSEQPVESLDPAIVAELDAIVSHAAPPATRT